jgi:uncharacterized hydrophobic protein (TIGR00271 family)
VLQLRVYGETATLMAVANGIDGLPGMLHIGFSAAATEGRALLQADLQPEAADAALRRLTGLGIPAEDIALVRLETIGPTAVSEPLVVVWADVLGQARVRARTAARYLVLMAIAGVIAGLAVINVSAVLIVGAMAISPDLLPVTAACTGLVLGRWRLARRGLITLVLGLVVTGALAAGVTLLLRLLDLMPDGFTLGEIPAAQTHVSATTILVAFAAGVAGMLAVESRASAAVGVAISVTTIPAAAYLGVAIGVEQLDKSWSALGVLAVNIALMLAGGSLALATQRLVAVRRESAGRAGD